MDEATSALDNVAEYHVQKAVNRLVKARTTFIVAHRLSTIRNADRIVVMEDGCAVEIGNYDELMKKGGKFCELERLSRIREEITSKTNYSRKIARKSIKSSKTSQKLAFRGVFFMKTKRLHERGENPSIMSYVVIMSGITA